MLMPIPDEPDEELVELVARLAADLLIAARQLGDLTIVAAAEVAACAAGRALAQSMRSDDDGP